MWGEGSWMTELDMGQGRVCVEIRLHAIRRKSCVPAKRMECIQGLGESGKHHKWVTRVCFRGVRWQAGSGNTALCTGHSKRIESSRPVWATQGNHQIIISAYTHREGDIDQWYGAHTACTGPWLHHVYKSCHLYKSDAADE